MLTVFNLPIIVNRFCQTFAHVCHYVGGLVSEIPEKFTIKTNAAQYKNATSFDGALQAI